MEIACRPVKYRASSLRKLPTLCSLRSTAAATPSHRSYVILFLFSYKISAFALLLNKFLSFCSFLSRLMFSPQANDVNIKYNVSGVTRYSTGTDGSLWDTINSEEILLATDTPPPFSEDFYPSSASGSPLLSPVDLALTRLIRPASSEQANQRGSPPMETCDLRY